MSKLEIIEQASTRRRVAVFASYSPDGILPPQVLPYLAGLLPLTDAIVVVFDNDLAPGEKEKLAPYAAHVITGRHGEYDFGSYKRGIAWARGAGLLETADDLILCNDSCYGPVGSFAPMFARMDARGLDFWGATDSQEYCYHIQSYFVVFGRSAFNSKAFNDFIASVTKQPNVQQVILKYELGFTQALQDAGLKPGAFLGNKFRGIHPDDRSHDNLTFFPLYCLTQGLPLLKVKALRSPQTNSDGPNRVLRWLKKNRPDTYKQVITDFEVKRFEDADQISFSLIMPTYNRVHSIVNAVSSVMDQTHSNFELIIVDDGSTDGTKELIEQQFANEIACKKIKYIELPSNMGVCRARNIGISHATNKWISYVDSDNEIRPYFLTMFANSIVENPYTNIVYGRFINTNSGKITGKPFDEQAIRKGNFIDLGVFIHRVDLFYELGGFDPELKRLVDWDLIIRYTKKHAPIFINRVLLNYSDRPSGERISTTESFSKANLSVISKHGDIPTVSTIIVSYNHQGFICEAIESALAQRGSFVHEILISDDFSTDGTRRIVSRYAEKYPNLIRDISRSRNYGVSENYKHCFRQASGKFIAVLEGDDYWTDPEKNLKQAEFLAAHPEATMVFSRIELMDIKSNKRRLLKRQDDLPSLLHGGDFAKNEHLNLIGNFSSAMFRKHIMSRLPSIVFDPRLNEITLSFYLDRLGKLGFIDNVMGVYRLNPDSVWTGASQISKLKQAISIREKALCVAKPAFRPIIQGRISEKRQQLASLLKNLEPAEIA